jgi:hypothetical protein
MQVNSVLIHNFDIHDFLAIGIDHKLFSSSQMFHLAFLFLQLTQKFIVSSHAQFSYLDKIGDTMIQQATAQQMLSSLS